VTGRASRGRRLGTTLRGAAAMVTLAALVVGLPLVLYRLGGDPIPGHVPAWRHVGTLLLHRDNGTVFLGAVRDISWIAWALFTVAVAAEVQAALRGRSAPRLRLGGLQNGASWLVALTTLAFSSQPAAVLASAPAAVSVVSAVRSGPPPARPAVRPAERPVPAHAADPRAARVIADPPAARVTAAGPQAPQVMSMGFYQMVTVRDGDCLWTIAQRYLGAGDRYTEIVKLNLGHEMGDGHVFTDPSVIWPGWVLQVPAGSGTASVSPTSPTPPASPAPAGHGASLHAGHDSADPRFRHPHPAASASQPTTATDPAGAGAPAAGARPPAPAQPTARATVSAQPVAAQLNQVPPFAVFGAGVLVGGATVALARMRRRQRQARRFGRRIPLPASAPVIAAEQRLRAAAQMHAGEPEPGPARHDRPRSVPYEGRTALYDGESALYDEAGLALYDVEDPGLALYPDAEPLVFPDLAPEPGPLLAPATALRAALSELGAGLMATGQPIPDITGIRVHRSRLEVLLGSPASEPPPTPFAVPGGRRGTAWQLDLPRHAPAEPFPPGPAGDLLPGLLTAGVASDGGYVLVDLEYLRVTTVDGPADLADLVLATAAAELTTSQLAGWYDLILAGFDELDPVDGRATCCASLAEALDLLATKAVALRRRLGNADRADVRRRRLADPGDEDWALTLLVSRVAPTMDEMAMLLDLASDPGGIAALVVGGTGIPEGHPAPASFRLSDDPARPGGIVGHLSPLHLDVWPQPLARDDYQALASLFATAADLQDVPADQPPYDGSSWPPAPGLIGLAEPPHPDPDPAPVTLDDPGLAPPAPLRVPGEDPPGAPSEPAGPPGLAGPAGDADQETGLRIGVLGAFTVNGAPAALQPAQSQLILALALNGRDGLSNAQLCYLLGADPDHPKPSDSLRQLIVRTRRQLGRAADGREWIEHLGAGQYALHPDANFDWADFEDLSERGIGDRDLGCLRQALTLIRGKPFTGCYHWWLDLAFTETVRAQIVDAAELLAELELAAGDPSASARAARTGLAGDVSAEQLWRALMRAEHAAGNLAGVREAWSRCLDAMTDIAADGEPHPDTAALYQQLIAGGRAPAAAQPGSPSTWVRSYR
jgi:DNA-binding SARP family transcriptional activator